MTIQELREKRAKAWDTARDFLDTKRTASGLLSEEDSKTYDAMEQQIVAYGKEIQRLERQEQLDAELNRPTSQAILQTPTAPNLPKQTSGTASDAYKTAFWNSIRNRNYTDIRNDLQVGTDSEGGYLVPDEFERQLVEGLQEENLFRTLATVIQTASGDRKIPVVTSKGEAAWMDEEAAYTLSDDAFGQASLSAYKVGTAIKISEELLNDAAFDLPAYITKEFARRIGAKEEEAFLVGDGKGKPTGIFNATGGAENGATTSTANITFDDVFELFYSVKSPYRKKGIWVLNDAWEEAFSCWARVTLKSSVENADTGVTKEVQTLDFYIRQQRQWMPSTSANRILFQGVVYDITSVTPDFIRKDYLKLTATARKAGENDVETNGGY